MDMYRISDSWIRRNSSESSRVNCSLMSIGWKSRSVARLEDIEFRIRTMSWADGSEFGWDLVKRSRDFRRSNLPNCSSPRRIRCVTNCERTLMSFSVNSLLEETQERSSDFLAVKMSRARGKSRATLNGEENVIFLRLQMREVINLIV